MKVSKTKRQVTQDPFSRLREERNAAMLKSAASNAFSLRMMASSLEKKMQELLSMHNIEYDFRHVFCILDAQKVITKYYIVEFYIPSKKCIVEIISKKKDNPEDIAKSRERIKHLRQYNPDIRYIELSYRDFQTPQKMQKILDIMLV